MVIVLFTLSLILIILVYAVQNPEQVPVRFLNWDLQISKVAILFFSLFVGAFVMNFWNALISISARRLFREFSQKISSLERELSERNKRIEDLEKHLVDAQARLEMLGAAETPALPRNGQDERPERADQSMPGDTSNEKT